jgi:hypothetical protein
MAQRVGRGIALLLHDLGTRRGEWSAARSGRSLPQERPGAHLQEDGWAPGPSGQAESLAPTGIRSPDRPAHSSVAIPTELPGLIVLIYNS